MGGVDFDLWLARQVKLRDARHQALFRELLELLRRLPDIGDAQSLAVMRDNVKEGTFRWFLFLPDERPRPIVLFERDTIPAHQHHDGHC